MKYFKIQVSQLMSNVPKVQVSDTTGDAINPKAGPQKLIYCLPILPLGHAWQKI